MTRRNIIVGVVVLALLVGVGLLVVGLATAEERAVEGETLGAYLQRRYPGLQSSTDGPTGGEAS